MCGIAGAFGVSDAAYVVSIMLKALQHRGQESAGIVSGHHDDRFRQEREFGLVDEVFQNIDFSHHLPGTAAIGHVRYSTSDDERSGKDGISTRPSKRTIQPFHCKTKDGNVAIAVNGNLTNYRELRQAMLHRGATFLSEIDSNIFLPLLSRSQKPEPWERLAEAIMCTEGATSMLMLDDFGLHAAVDPYGYRPLVWARYEDGYLFASETMAFDIFKAGEYGVVKPGTVVSVSPNGSQERGYARAPALRHCSFCHVYFSRPDSEVFGQSSYQVRERLGEALAKRCPVEADLALAVPDSANVMALAYAQSLGIPFSFALMRSHYMGRTFITPKQAARELGVRMKLNAVRAAVAGKRVAVVDDSKVRGTTSRRIVRLLRQAGAAEVHMLLASPPVIHPCYWGIDTPQRSELIAAKVPLGRMAETLGADSVGYLSVPDLLNALGDPQGKRHCVACFTGKHPTADLDRPVSLLADG